MNTAPSTATPSIYLPSTRVNITVDVDTPMSAAGVARWTT